jgi:hypothetical protein
MTYFNTQGCISKDLISRFEFLAWWIGRVERGTDHVKSATSILGRHFIKRTGKRGKQRVNGPQKSLIQEAHINT